MNFLHVTKCTGCLKKGGGDLFYAQYLHQIKLKSAGYIFNLKAGIQARPGVQNHCNAISGNRGISKTIWGIRFDEFEILNNLISLNLILPR